MTQLQQNLLRLAQEGRPVLVGPWMGEVGFEVLYWIPFLRWALAFAGLPREQVWVLSRGGCRSWYADIAGHYLELYDLFSTGEVINLNTRRIEEQAARGRSIHLRHGQRVAKQVYGTDVEANIVALAKAKAGIPEACWFHPGTMYGTFRPAWKLKRDLFGTWAEHTRAQRLQAPPRLPGLPARYVAVKFYASACATDVSGRRELVRRLVRALTDVGDVVLLHTGRAYDDHGEFPVPQHPRIHRPKYEPRQNLDTQTAVVAGADAYVGTYGGFAYLAPFLGIPTLALYGVRNFRRDHLRLAGHAAGRLKAPFTVAPLEAGVEMVKAHRATWGPRAAA